MKINSKARFETLKFQILELPPFELNIGTCMTLNQRDSMIFFLICFYKLTPHLIKLNIPTHN